MSTDAESERSAETERKTETIPEWKRDEVDAIVDIVRSYDSVGVVDVGGIPSRQLQNMRRDLHGTAQLRISRNTLLQRAIDEVDEGLEVLGEFVSGQVGLIGTNDNPFGLFKELESSKTPAPIKAGEVAPNDVVIEAGDTGIDPGPFVGELQQVGANARIDEGSIKVMEDSTVAHSGEVVSSDLANVLNELGIEPKEVGLDLRAVYADGVLFEPDELEIDVGAYEGDVRTAATRAVNLSVNAAFPTDDTVRTLVQTARGEAKGLAVHAAIEDPDVVPDLVGKADAQVRAVVARIDDREALPEGLQDVESPAAERSGADPDADGDDDETTDEQSEADAETDDGDDENDGDAGDALGEMF